MSELAHGSGNWVGFVVVYQDTAGNEEFVYAAKWPGMTLLAEPQAGGAWGLYVTRIPCRRRS